MIYRYARIVAATLVILLLSIPGVAQEDKKVIKSLTSASLDGATGLFRTWDAETLKKGEFNLSAGIDYTNRDPGRLIIRKFPLAVGFGITDRLELFGSWDVLRSINAPGVLPYGTLPGQVPMPAANLFGMPYYSNDAPFMDVPNASGVSDVRFGGIYNLWSQQRTGEAGVSVAGFVKLPAKSSTLWLNRGLSNGVTEGGGMFLISKRIQNAVKFYGNLGINFAGTPTKHNIDLADLQNSFLYRGGISFPNSGLIVFSAEMLGTKYFGGNTDPLNPKSPFDAIFGFKIYPREWMTIGGGYQAHLNRVETNLARGIFKSGVNGFVAQVTFEKRKHEAPKVTLAVSPASVTEGETATARASVVAPRDTAVHYAWTASGGKLSGSGDTATFDSTGLAPGKYSITVTVTDDYKHSVPATAEVTVNKRYLPPTVACSVAPISIQVGESATVTAKGNSPDGSPLTYAWTLNGQAQAASGPTYTFGSTGRQAGNYTIGVTVNTGKFAASCSSSVTVREIPIPPPTIQCLTPTADIESGGTANLRVQATAERATANMTWNATGGTINGSGQTAIFNAAGLSAGTYAITSTVDNGLGARASCTMTVNVSQKINVPGFDEGKFRVNNVAKAILDNVAVQLKSDPRLRATVTGYADSSRIEGRVKDLAQKRAQAVVDYLVSKGIEASRCTAVSGGVSAIGDPKTKEGRADNRHVEITLGIR